MFLTIIFISLFLFMFIGVCYLIYFIDYKGIYKLKQPYSEAEYKSKKNYPADIGKKIKTLKLNKPKKEKKCVVS